MTRDNKTRPETKRHRPSQSTCAHSPQRPPTTTHIVVIIQTAQIETRNLNHRAPQMVEYKRCKHPDNPTSSQTWNNQRFKDNLCTHKPKQWSLWFVDHFSRPHCFQCIAVIEKTVFGRQNWGITLRNTGKQCFLLEFLLGDRPTHHPASSASR